MDLRLIEEKKPLDEIVFYDTGMEFQAIYDNWKRLRKYEPTIKTTITSSMTFKEKKMIRILLGGSPCTQFSIAQKNNRETQPNSGIGWELFKNYLIAKEKFKPDYFLYENNVSAAQPIKDEIKKQFGVWDDTFLTPYSDVRYIEINSALVSAQNRERFYVHNCGEVGQPKDRGILLKDVLISGYDFTGNEKSYALTTRCNGAIPEDTLTKHRHNMVAEPVIFQVPHGYNNGGMKYGKAPTLTASGYWQENNKVIEPINYEIEFDSDDKPTKAYCYADGKIHTVYEVKHGKITIKGKEYPIKLTDGFYIIRKLTVKECCRLQGMPEWWFKDKDGNKLISDTQAYKGLGNGWQLETVKYILQHALCNIPKDEPILLLSLYDGIGTGRRILEELGFTNVKYIAYEIDKYCIALTSYRYPDIIHKGDAFQVRNDDWEKEINSITKELRK